VEDVRAAFDSGRTLSKEFRLHNLKQLLRLYEDNTDQMLDALREDMGKPRFDALVYELEYIITDLKCTISKLHKWMTPFKVSVNIAI
jgi:acyl-CoA reductase-like NAD-dependent aldehyde dehydrogenase